MISQQSNMDLITTKLNQVKLDCNKVRFTLIITKYGQVGLKCNKVRFG